MFIHELSIQYCATVYSTGLCDEGKQCSPQGVSCFMNCILTTSTSISNLIYNRYICKLIIKATAGYNTDQKKPNKECLTEHVLFPFHMCFRFRSTPVPYPVSLPAALFCSVPILLAFHWQAFSELVKKNGV